MAEKMRFSTRGQMMVWVILAILLVASMLLFFTIDRRPEITVQKDFNVESFIEKCAKKHANDAVDILLPQGGFLNPMNVKVYNDIKIAYLCENVGNYEPCINQHPMLLNEIKEEIKNYASPRIEQCFSELREEIRKKKGEVSYEPMNLDVSLGPGKIYLNVGRKVVVKNEGDTQTFDGFYFEMINPVYDLANIAIEIASQEVKYCYFEYVGYMVLYPQFDIRVHSMSDSTSIYTIKDKKSGKEMNIAIRSCAIPPGI